MVVALLKSLSSLRNKLMSGVPLTLTLFKLDEPRPNFSFNDIRLFDVLEINSYEMK